MLDILRNTLIMKKSSSLSTYGLTINSLQRYKYHGIRYQNCEIHDCWAKSSDSRAMSKWHREYSKNAYHLVIFFCVSVYCKRNNFTQHYKINHVAVNRIVNISTTGSEKISTTGSEIQVLGRSTNGVYNENTFNF